MIHVKTGLVSVTFRQQKAETVLDWVEEAGLEAIEWGGDIHVPPGDIARARQLGELTRRRGILVPTYGSYYRAGELSQPEAEKAFDDVLAAAVALQAAGIRVWAGRVASAEADAAHWDRTMEDLARIRDRAAREGLEIYLEYHNNTLNDRAEATERLLAALAGPPAVRTFWQPLNELDEAAKDKTLAAARPWLAHIHVFANQGASELLATDTARWLGWLPRLLDEEAENPFTASGTRCLMIEFVKDASKASLLSDAQTLRSWLSTLHSS